MKIISFLKKNIDTVTLFLFLMLFVSAPLRRFDLFFPFTKLSSLILKFWYPLSVSTIVFFLKVEIKRKDVLLKYLILSFFYVLFALLSLVLDVFDYRNFSYFYYGIPYEMAGDMLILGIIIGILAYIKYFYFRNKVLLRYSLLLLKKLFISPRELLITIIIITILVINVSNFDFLAPQPAHKNSIFGDESVYLNSLAILNNDCPIVIPPYDNIYPPDDRWTHIKIPPIVRSFVFPKLIINSALFDGGALQNEILRKYPCLYVHEYDYNHKLWPVIINNTISFNRDYSTKINFDKIEKISHDKFGKVLKIYIDN